MYNNIAPYYDKLGWSQYSLKLWQQIKKHVITGAYNPRTHLDLGSGTGAMCMEAAKEGMQTEGLDVSVNMVNFARQKTQLEVLDILYHLSDIRYFNTGKEYELITCVFDTINHILSMDEWKKVFTCVRQHLRNGGVFVFDCSTIKAYKDQWNGFHSERDGNGNYMLQKSFYSYEHRMATRTISVFFKQEEEGLYKGFEETFNQTSFESSQIVEMLREAGFYDNIITNLSFGELDDPDKENRNIYICR